MKLLSLLFLLATSHVYAQITGTVVGRDSLPFVFPHDVDSPDLNWHHRHSSDLIPNARPNNSFYRYHLDPPDVMRATLDNMPVKKPDLSINYTILRSYQKPGDPPMRFFRPMPPMIPKKP